MKYAFSSLNSGLFCVGLAAATMPCDVLAQHADSASIEEIIVTVQRRASRLEDVPMSVLSITPEAIENSGITSLYHLGQIAPGVQVQPHGGFTKPAIRGVTTLTSGNSVENNVAIYVDGFYEPNSLIVNMDLANVESIEVLKGPQGTLYGRNATGGAILINTKAPSEMLTGKLDLSYGRFDDKRISGYVSGPITENVRYSVSGYDRKSDGWIELINPNTGGASGDAAPLEERAIRSALEVDIPGNITATIAYNYAFVDKPLGLLFSTFEYEPSYLPPPPARPTEFGEAAYNYETESPATVHQGTVKLVWGTSIGTLTSYTGYNVGESEQSFDFDGTYADFTSFNSRFEQEVFQQALDFNVEIIDNAELIVGGFYYKDDNATHPDTGIKVFGSNRSLLYTNYADAEANAVAVYTDAAFHLTDRMTFNLGGRYSDEEKTSFFVSTTPAGLYVFPPTEKSKDYSQFTWSASLRYEILPQSNIYALYSNGFRSGYFNLSGAATPALWQPLDPELIDAYEVGFKTSREGVRFNAAAFYYDYQDLHISTTTPSPLCPTSEPDCGRVTIFTNAPKAEIYGLDGQLLLTPIESLNMRIGVAWLHARYEELPNVSGTGLNSATGTNVTGQTQDWSGKEMARAPRLTGNIGIDYETPLAGGSLLLAGNVSYSDSYVVNNPSLYGPLAGPRSGNQRYRQDSMTLVNAQASWTDASGHYSVTVFGSNLTDKEYRTTYSGSTFGDYNTQAKPASYGIKLGYQF